MDSIFYRIARSLPISLQKQSQSFVREAGKEVDPSIWLAKTLLVGLLCGVVAGIVLSTQVELANAWLKTLHFGVVLDPILGGILGFVLGLGMGLAFRYVQIYYIVEARSRTVENILPDFLLLVAGNIRAGMTSFSAFRGSARPEFGALSEEIKSVSARSLGVESFTEALSSISNKIKSRNLTETVGFFLQAMKSGGRLAQLLENTSADLRRTQDLKKELQSATATYVIFVGFVIVVATPLLMAVSVEFVELIGKIQGQSLASGAADLAGSGGFVGGKISITPEFLTGIAYILLFGNSFLAGLFMGTIGSSKPLMGLRYTLPMFAISLVVFFISKGFLKGLLGLA
jgi:flagellar protein FlaJ